MKPVNRIKVRDRGPLLCTGQVQVVNAAGKELYNGDDVVLCRCGVSANKPFCDGSHRTSGFDAGDDISAVGAGELESDEGTLVITVRDNAMLIAKGPMVIGNADGSQEVLRARAALCRCGHSKKKPLCDASHKACGFKG